MFGNLFKSMMGGGSNFKSVAVAGAKELIDAKKVFLLDVRSREEFANGHIKGAKNIPVNELASRIGDISREKEKPVLVNCLSGGRSASACAILSEHGFTDVTNMSGGIGAWMAARYPITH